MNADQIKGKEQFKVSPEISKIYSSLHNGAFNNYTLRELEEVEQNLSRTYTALNNEQMRIYERSVHKMFTDLINLQDARETIEQKIEEAEKANPEYVPLATFKKATEDLASGKMSTLTLPALKRVKEELKKAYFTLSPENRGTYDRIIMDVASLQTKEEKRQKALEQADLVSLLNEFGNDVEAGQDYKKRQESKYAAPQSDRIVLIEGDYEVESKRTVAAQRQKLTYLPQVKEIELTDDDIEVIEEEEPITIRRRYNILSSDGACNFSAYGSFIMKKRDAVAREVDQDIDMFSFLPKVLLYNPADDTPEIEVEEIEVDVAELQADVEEKEPVTQRSVVYIPGTQVPDLSDIDFDALDRQLGYKPVATESSVVVAPVEVTQNTLENIVAIAPAKSKNKAVGYIAAAAIALAGSLAGLYTGFTHIYSSLKNTADVAHSENQGTPSVQPAAPVKTANAAPKAKSIENVPKENAPAFPQKTVETPKTSEQKVKRIPPRPTTNSGSGIHTIQSGDTVFYNLCAGDVKCAKEMWRINPGVDLNNLYPGQKLNMVSGSYDKILSQVLTNLDCESLHDLNKTGDVDGMAGKLKPIRDNLSRIGVELDYLNCKANARK